VLTPSLRKRKNFPFNPIQRGIRKDEFGDGLSLKSVFAMMNSRYWPTNKEEFLLCLEHFQKDISTAKYLLTFDGHASHFINIHDWISMKK
jgi:hypothetical protein